MFVNLNIPYYFSEVLQQFVVSFKTRIIEYENSLVNGNVTSTILVLCLLCLLLRGREGVGESGNERITEKRVVREG